VGFGENAQLLLEDGDDRRRIMQDAVTQLACRGL
jgi:hypothetical protein